MDEDNRGQGMKIDERRRKRRLRRLLLLDCGQSVSYM